MLLLGGLEVAFGVGFFIRRCTPRDFSIVDCTICLGPTKIKLLLSLMFSCRRKAKDNILLPIIIFEFRKITKFYKLE